MKKILGILFVLVLIPALVFGAYQWRGGTGENSILGTEAGADIDKASYQNIVSPLDRLLSNYRTGCNLVYLSASTVTIESGEITVSNSGGTIRLMQQNTSSGSVDITSDFDTGSEAVSTTYYIYAYQNTVTDSDFDLVISAGSSAPTGTYTYYKRLGSFYNNADGDIEQITNDHAVVGGVPTGMIAMWHGTIANIPTGWVLCNGSSGTPDLREKFVRGAAASTEAGGTGGADTNTATHTYSGTTSSYAAPSSTVDGGNPAGGTHTHTYSGTSSAPSDTENMPAYYAILFIMKQ